MPISPLMIFGSDVIDFLSGLVKRRYRMFVYARKTALAPAECLLTEIGSRVT